MSEIPYLSVEERVEFLLEKGYTQETEASDEVREFLRHINFHHFLGYARNYGALASRGQIAEEPTLQGIVDVILLDQRVSAYLFTALQRLEWQLRAQLVEFHCELFSPVACFLQEEHYLKMDLDRDTPDVNVVRQILRMKEPYVEDRLKRYMDENSLTGKPEKLAHPHSILASERFPIWAIVDGLSFGTLVDMILCAKPKDGRKLRSLVAADCSVANPIFETQLRSMITLRNQVAHHSRLWMRPTTNSPKAPNRHSKRARGVAAKAMYTSCLALASLLKGLPQQHSFLDGLDGLIAENGAYEVGVKQLLIRK